MQPKYFINNTNFPQGFITPDDSWNNRWRSGLNSLLGWSATLPGSGNGAKSLGQELESSAAFANCQVTRVFKYVCLRAPSNCGRHARQITSMIASFQSNNYSLRQVFAEAAAYCMGRLIMNVHTHHSGLAGSGARGVAGPQRLRRRGRADHGQRRPPRRPARPTPTPDPRPATADVQAFQVNFWNNMRGQNRCGQCHNATSPAQMPNFARSDDVNLAYAQANTVVNLAAALDLADRHQGERRPQLLARGSERLRRDLDHLDQQLGRRRRSAASGTQVQLQAPPVQTVGQSMNFPAVAGRLRRPPSIRC